ncbi:MAG: L-glutamate gamma-semialdehyde dehydrogenase [Sphingobacteriales bacterium]|nr:L-glutamate gamma-semialdehyde dehydrogenase [Sphingobacteriales bacterium]
MPKGIFHVPTPANEPVKSYAAGSPERTLLKEALRNAKSKQEDLPLIIDGKAIRTHDVRTLHPPHERAHTLAQYHYGDSSHVEAAIQAALRAKADWENMPWEHRAAIFLKAAELLATKYRYAINAATMLGQSKNAYQAEIDAACELIDFLRFNVAYMQHIYNEQPISSAGVWNRLEYRPLEGFVLAVTPFNFTAIAGNLPSSPALMGNTVVWKPAETQVLSAHVIMQVFEEAGLPAGVINLVQAAGSTIGNTVFKHRDFAGLHFTGSTGTFNYMWKTVGENIANYRSYPRLVGETGGKDFVLAHPSALPEVVVTALSRGAFEYQGQKCSAASRAYIPSNIWKSVEKGLKNDLASFKMGTVEDFSNFVNAVIDEKSFNSITAYIEKAKKDPNVEILIGGSYSKEQGYFIEPTVLLTTDPNYTTMCEEIFGPVLTIYVYKPKDYDKVLDLIDNTSPYALTGAIISQDRAAIVEATQRLRHAAGNFYINDKPTGAVVGQQPFGGARASGTNDKAGSLLNLLRWTSARAIKETFVPPTDYRYPFLG